MALFVSGCWVSYGMPMYLSGVLLSPEEGTGDYPRRLRVRIDAQYWTMNIRSADRLDNGKRAWPVLESIRKSVVLTGAPELLASLKSADMRGCPLRLEGRLYERQRVFVLDRFTATPTRLQR